MKISLLILFGWVFIIHPVYSQSGEKSCSLTELDLTKMTCVMGTPKKDLSIKGTPMSIAGQAYERGVGTHAYSRLLVDLHKSATSFSAMVGMDDAAYVHASVSFYVLGDKKILWESGPMKKGEHARKVNVDVTGISKLGLLVIANRDDISENYANWANAEISFNGAAPTALNNTISAKQWGILTPSAPAKPVINGPSVYGVRPGSPVLYRIPATGDRPMTFSIQALPEGLMLDRETGIITGKLLTPGKFTMTLVAKNRKGRTKKKFSIHAGDQLALTPPMGWNSWYIHYHSVSDSLMRKAADVMIESGMADYGYQYVNIDDCWMNKPESNNPEESGPTRNTNGQILPNKRFPDMVSLTSYIHSKGLKAGIYSSPGPKTCAGYEGSYGHELQDAQTYVKWGFDFLKYDWCSYGSIAGSHTLQGMKAPFLQMGEALSKSGRDILFNLCQYGMGDVWEWGAAAGHSWRIGPDLGTATGSYIPGFYTTGLNNSAHWKYAGPGAWNDPDYINIGWVGGSGKNSTGRKIALTPNEQYAYMSMWSLMASPLFFSGDMNRLDEFTLNILCNREVIAINQDALGKQARIIRNDSSGMIMVKELADGSKAVGLFNYPGNRNNPVDYFVWNAETDGSRILNLTAADLGWTGKLKIRNVWTQQSLGSFTNGFSIKVPYHGVILLKISQ